MACALGLLGGCAGGVPLLYPAEPLPSGQVRAATGLSGNVAALGLASDLRVASGLASDPSVSSDPVRREAYAKGALVAAAVAPGLAPVIAARVGIAGDYEGGMTYTGRGVRIDGRRAWRTAAGLTLSAGAGVSVAFYGRDESETLPRVDVSELHGYGADVPLLVGWQSDAGLYHLWGGIRGGYGHVTIDHLTSEPKSPALVPGPVALSADQLFAGGLVGVATGFRHVHVAVEVSLAYQWVRGKYNDSETSVQGLTATPAGALWWDF